jgi:uncharacterized membrane protein YdfJ with MMPL/SSD domain
VSEAAVLPASESPLAPAGAPGSAAVLPRVLRNAGALLAAYVLPRSLTFAAALLAARVLRPSSFGAYGMAAALAMTLSVLCSLGLLPLLVRDLARAPGRGRSGGRQPDQAGRESAHGTRRTPAPSARRRRTRWLRQCCLPSGTCAGRC